MSTEATLLLLRIASGITLLLLLGMLFFILWRNYHHAVSAIEAGRRVYGQLIALHEVNGSYMMTGARYPLYQLTSLGRSPTNSIAIEDTFASSEHAIVTLRSGQWWLEDRQSRNGTTLNEMLITQPTVITDGDIIGIGKMRFRVDLEK